VLGDQVFYGVAAGGRRAHSDNKRVPGAKWPTEQRNDETRVEVKRKGGRWVQAETDGGGAT